MASFIDPAKEETLGDIANEVTGPGLEAVMIFDYMRQHGQNVSYILETLDRDGFSDLSFKLMHH